MKFRRYNNVHSFNLKKLTKNCINTKHNRSFDLLFCVSSYKRKEYYHELLRSWSNQPHARTSTTSPSPNTTISQLQQQCLFLKRYILRLIIFYNYILCNEYKQVSATHTLFSKQLSLKNVCCVKCFKAPLSVSPCSVGGFLKIIIATLKWQTTKRGKLDYS